MYIFTTTISISNSTHIYKSPTTPKPARTKPPAHPNPGLAAAPCPLEETCTGVLVAIGVDRTADEEAVLPLALDDTCVVLLVSDPVLTPEAGETCVTVDLTLVTVTDEAGLADEKELVTVGAVVTGAGLAEAQEQTASALVRT